jgi:hypothetical protein
LKKSKKSPWPPYFYAQNFGNFRKNKEEQGKFLKIFWEFCTLNRIPVCAAEGGGQGDF